MTAATTKARRGDLVVIERTQRSFTINPSSSTETTDYVVMFEVTR